MPFLIFKFCFQNPNTVQTIRVFENYTIPPNPNLEKSKGNLINFGVYYLAFYYSHSSMYPDLRENGVPAIIALLGLSQI